MTRRHLVTPLALGALLWAGCADLPDGADDGASGGPFEEDMSHVAGVRVIGAALNSSDAEGDLNLGTDKGAQTTVPALPSLADLGVSYDASSGALSVTMTSSHKTVLIGYVALTKQLRINNLAVPCKNGDGSDCVDSRGLPVPFVTLNSRLPANLKVVTVNIPAGLTEANVVLDYRQGIFLPSSAATSVQGVKVVAGGGASWRLGAYGSSKADAFTVGDAGFAVNRDASADLAWTGPSPELAVLYGGLGNDVITGVGDTMTAIRGVGGAFDGVLEAGGGDGNDKLTGGDGEDLLFGLAGNDTFIIDAAESLKGDVMDGGLGADIADYRKATAPIVFSANKAWLPFTAPSGLFVAQRCRLPVGALPNDPKAIWETVDYPAWLTEQAAIDRLEARSTDGRLISASCKPLEQDCATEGDVVKNVERVNGTPFNDVLAGDCGSNLLYGNLGDDWLFPGGGVGGAGDALYGEGGDDRLHAGDFKNGPTAFFGGPGTGDVLTFGARSRGVLVSPQRSKAGIAGLSGERVTPASATSDEGDAVSDFEVLVGTAGDDLLTGTSAPNKLYGGEGNDTLRGEKGNDSLFGGDGNDQLIGGPGNDGLVGGLGADVLQGEAGVDAHDGDRGRFCKLAETTLCATDADCGANGPCVTDLFCPPEALSCDDLHYGGPGADKFRAGLDRGADVFNCGNENREELLGTARELRRTKDNLDFTGASGAVEVSWGDDTPDGQGGLADAASHDGDAGDIIGGDCETASTGTPPTTPLTGWSLTPETAGLKAGEAVTLTLSAPAGALRTDVAFSVTAGDEGMTRLLHPRVVDGEVAISFLAFVPGSYEVTATLGANALATSAISVASTAQTCPGCNAPTHCATSGPAEGTCVLDSCFDGVPNGTEAGVDCGGDCPVACRAATCSDGVRNGLESDVDCGGPSCAACAAGDMCATTLDCGGATCRANRCQPMCGGCGASQCDLGSGRCTICPTGRDLVDGQCLRPCPGGSSNVYPSADGRCACDPSQYLSADGSACVDCPANCELCGAGGRCDQCGTGFRPNADGLCVAFATTCTGANYAANPDDDGRCVCAEGFIADPVSGACKLPGEVTCPAGTTAANGVCGCGAGKYRTAAGTCGTCPAGCTACDSDGGWGVTCSTCTAGDPKAQVPPHLFFDGRCVARCPVGAERTADGTACACKPAHFLDGGACKRCLDGCLACDSASVCETCATGFSRLNGLCVPTAELPANAVATGGDYACPPASNFDPVDLTCETCASGEGFADGACVPTTECPDGNCFCAAGDYMSRDDANMLKCLECAQGCLACDGASACDTCNTASGWHPWSGACVKCAAGQTFDPVAGRCVVPQSGSDGTPVSCEAGWFRDGGTNTCVRMCPVGAFANLVTNTCDACDPGCAACSGAATSCTRCPTGKLLWAGTCNDACPSGTLADSPAGRCHPAGDPPCDSEMMVSGPVPPSALGLPDGTSAEWVPADSRVPEPLLASDGSTYMVSNWRKDGTDESNPGFQTGRVTRISPQGEILWNREIAPADFDGTTYRRTLTGPMPHWLSGAVELPDGGVAVYGVSIPGMIIEGTAGHVAPPDDPETNRQGFVIAYWPDGTVRWWERLPGGRWSGATAHKDHLAVVGLSFMGQHGTIHSLSLRTGALTASRSVSATYGYSRMNSVVAVRDGAGAGDFIVAGGVFGHNQGGFDLGFGTQGEGYNQHNSFFVARYSPTLTPVWQESASSYYPRYGNYDSMNYPQVHLALTTDGQVVAAGRFNGNLRFSSGQMLTDGSTDPSSNLERPWSASLSIENGSPRWARVLGQGEGFPNIRGLVGLDHGAVGFVANEPHNNWNEWSFTFPGRVFWGGGALQLGAIDRSGLVAWVSPIGASLPPGSYNPIGLWRGPMGRLDLLTRDLGPEEGWRSWMPMAGGKACAEVNGDPKASGQTGCTYDPTGGTATCSACPSGTSADSGTSGVTLPYCADVNECATAGRCAAQGLNLQCVNTWRNFTCEPCPDGTYADAGTGRCELCHASCNTCSGPSPSACEFCPEYSAWQDGACLPPWTGCPTGNYSMGVDLNGRWRPTCAACPAPESSAFLFLDWGCSSCGGTVRYNETVGISACERPCPSGQTFQLAGTGEEGNPYFGTCVACAGPNCCAERFPTTSNAGNPYLDIGGCTQNGCVYIGNGNNSSNENMASDFCAETCPEGTTPQTRELDSFTTDNVCYP